MAYAPDAIAATPLSGVLASRRPRDPNRPKIPHQSIERVLEPFHLEDAVVFRFPGCVKPEHAKVIRVRKDQDTGERMYDVEPEDEKQRMKTPV